LARLVLPVWEASFPTDRRPHVAVDAVDAWLDGRGSEEAVATAHAALQAPPAFTFDRAALAAGETVREAAACVPTASADTLGRLLDHAGNALSGDGRWRYATVDEVCAAIVRAIEGAPPPSTGTSPRWRLERSESTGGDLYEIVHRRRFYVVDAWTGAVVVSVEGESSGAYDGSGWGDLSSSGVEEAWIEGDALVVQVAGAGESRLPLG